uniref:Uncharacterized protein n=1 Tax=Klebsiella phage vB_KpnM_Iguana_ER37 TaxID=3076781 RepID=A0AB38Z414_9CAUD
MTPGAVRLAPQTVRMLQNTQTDIFRQVIFSAGACFDFPTGAGVVMWRKRRPLQTCLWHRHVTAMCL